jgi:sec-independent protein translocase protein TatA
MSFGAGHWPLILILLVIVLIFWGPSKLPDIGAGMGKAIREFRKATSDVHDSVNKATSSEPEKDPVSEPVTTAKTESKEERPTTV